MANQTQQYKVPSIGKVWLLFRIQNATGSVNKLIETFVVNFCQMKKEGVQRNTVLSNSFNRFEGTSS